MKFNKEKWKVLHLGKNNPRQQLHAGGHPAEKQVVREGPGGVGGHQVEREPTICPSHKGGKMISWAALEGVLPTGWERCSLFQQWVMLFDSILSGVPCCHKTCLSRPRMVFRAEDPGGAMFPGCRVKHVSHFLLCPDWLKGYHMNYLWSFQRLITAQGHHWNSYFRSLDREGSQSDCNP